MGTMGTVDANAEAEEEKEYVCVKDDEPKGLRGGWGGPIAHPPLSLIDRTTGLAKPKVKTEQPTKIR